MRFSPIVLAAVTIISLLIADHFGFNIVLCIFIILLLLCSLYSFIKHKFDIVLLLMIMGIIVPAGAYTLASSSHAHPTIEYIDKEVILTGSIISSAQESAYNNNYKYTFKVKNITENGVNRNINDTVLLVSPHKLSCGADIIASGAINSIREQMNENGFNMAQYYKSRNIFTRVYSENIEFGEPVPTISLSMFCGKFRDFVDNIIYKYYHSDGAALLSAVLTGNTHHFSDDYNALLNKTGLKHLFHPAFLHILIITSLFGMFSGIVQKRARDVSVTVILIIFALINSEQIGFVRCCLSFILMIFFRKKNGSAYYPDIIAWILIVCSLCTPMILFNSGFILSITAGIIIWAFGPYFTEKLSFLPRIIRRTAATMIILAFLYTPVSLSFFNGVCVYAFILPFVTMPLVMVIIICALPVFAMLGLIGTAVPIKPYLDTALYILLKLPGIVERLPFSRIIIPTPSPSVMLLIISLLFLFYFYIKKKKLNYVAAVSCGLVISVVLSAISRVGTTNFTFVNVGQGDGAVIHTAYGATVIIDGGGSMDFSEYNPGESIYVPYLESKGYTDIDAAFITHFHSDHAQGVIAAIENLRVKNVFVPACEDDRDESSLQLLAQLQSAADANGTVVHYITENKKLCFEHGLSVSVYDPGKVIRISEDENDSSLLIKAEYGNTSVLYTGDMTAFAEREYIKRGIDLSSDVLKVAHHGSSTSTCEEWLDSVNPSLAVISCGKDNYYGHPTKQTLNNLNNINILRTDINGDIIITADKTDIRKISVLK